MRIAILLLFTLLINPIISLGQNNKYKAYDILKADTIIWYGFDFSQLKLTNGDKVDQAATIKYRDGPAWVECLEESFTESELRKCFYKKYIINTESTKSSFELLDDNNWVIVKPFALDTGLIGNIIKQYDHQNNKGIGLVVLLENFNKYQEEVSEFMVFFDIVSNEIIYLVRITGKTYGIGMTKHWCDHGVVEITKDYLVRHLRKDLRKLSKN